MIVRLESSNKIGKSEGWEQKQVSKTGMVWRIGSDGIVTAAQDDKRRKRGGAYKNR